MWLKDLIKGLETKKICGETDIEITNLAFDSRNVKENGLFVCIDGAVTDGHKYIDMAYENGARAFVVEKECEVPAKCAKIEVESARYALAYLANAFYGHITKQLPLVGVTGTKGKTTMTYMIKRILEQSQKKVGLVGTIGNMIADKVIYNQRSNTTPESLDLQMLFSQMKDEGVDVAVMEVSSQGLMLHRVGCCEYKLAAFTNIETDHIGPNEHKDFDDYFNQKLKLFKMCETAVINIDDPRSNRVIEACDCKYFTYGETATADYCASEIKTFPYKVEFHAKTPSWEDKIILSVPGGFNVSNALGAIAICDLLGVDKEAIKEALADFRVKGRTEIVYSCDKYTVMIDYAHNAMSLESLLKAVRKYAPGRIVTLFGCGGNRDRNRRFEMGEVSGKLSDFTIITSDNPRNEEPEAIINDIETGINKTSGKYIKITSRKEAMKYAMENAQQDDIIIFAGKGHETYQIFSDRTIHFDEREVVQEILSGGQND